MNRKHLMSILVAITIITTLVISTLFAQLVSSTATTYNTDNITVNGVLASDSYVLYPYEDTSLIWGFSKYGELINGATKQGLEYNGMDVFANPNVLEKDWSQGWFIDIHYADTDDHYQNAWAFAMYSDLVTGGVGGDWKEACTLGPLGAPHGGRKTNVWATTDPIKVLYDGPRRFVAQTRTTLYGANTHLIADGLVNVTLTFVYNKDKKDIVVFKDIKRLDQGKFGRSFQVEFSNRGEWDIGTTSSPPSYAYFYDDLSTAYDYDYHNYYGPDYLLSGYDMCQMIDEAGAYVGFVAYWPQLFGKMVKATNTITRTDILSSLSTVVKNDTWENIGNETGEWFIDFDDQGWVSSDPYPRGGGTASDEPMVFLNGVLLHSPGEYDWDDGVITFVDKPSDTDYITIEYKHEIPDWSRDQEGHAGVDNIGHWSTEPGTPYVIGEWCFELTTAPDAQQFRAVSVYGLTDRHDADDANASGEDWSDGSNVVDCEVKYLLNETFNPFDLYSAVEKKDYRWVDITDLTATTTYIELTDGLDDAIYYVNASSELTNLGWTSPDWTGYYFRNNTVNATGEWVNVWEDGSSYVYSGNWAAHLNAAYSTHNSGIQEEMLKITPTGFGPLGDLTFSDLVDFSFWYKTVSGSGSSTNQGPSIEIKLYNSSSGAFFATLKQFDNYNASTSWQQYTLNNIDYYLHTGYTADNAWYISDGATIVKDSDGTTITTGAAGAHSYEWWNKRLRDFKVAFVAIDMQNGDAYVDDVGIAYLDLISGLRCQRVYNMEEDKLVPSDWNAYCSFAERVLINGVLIDRYPYHLLRNYVEGGYAPYYTIDFETGLITFYHYVTGTGYTARTLPIGTHIKVLYSTIEMNEKGRYEWMVLGKDARTIDSAAAAYVSEAFDSTKDIRVEMMGMDIREYDYGPNSPYVMAGATTSVRNDYNDSLGRPHLKDDWCTTWPISSSNMIFMAGPRANLGTEYMNEFTNAFFARSEYVVNNTGQSNTIMGLSCWNFNNYSYSYGVGYTYGYGVISVYKDLNGTIGLVFWGYTADDYYYTCKWFWSYSAGITCPDDAIVYSGIEYLQHENRGVTDIILKITYPTADPSHPTVAVSSERLGTISEKTQHDP